MKVVALVSGGKDSCFNMMHCVAEGHEIVALANLCPPPGKPDELDSWMFQTVGHDIVGSLYSEALQLPLYRHHLTGTNVSQAMHYTRSLGDETENLFALLKEVLSEHPDIEAISVGAIASNYQRLRVEDVASRLGLVVLAYLWERDQTSLLSDMVDAGVEAILIKTACVGLDSRHLGWTLAKAQNRLMQLHAQYGVHPCGEGGEYETLVLDCPIFMRRLELIDEQRKDSEDGTSYLKAGAVLIDKAQAADSSWQRICLKSSQLDLPFTRIKWPQLNDRQFSPVELKKMDAQPQGLTKVDSAAALTINRYVFTDENINDLGHAVQGPREDVLVCFLVLRSMADFAAVNAQYARLWQGFHPPARVCVASHFLDQNTRAVMHVVRPTYRTTDPNDNGQRLWVQSQSFWAPANIGPYSQSAVSSVLGAGAAKHRIGFVSGQIGLIPSTMALPLTDVRSQIQWSLQSLLRIVASQSLLKSVGSQTGSAVLVAYLIDVAHVDDARAAARQVGFGLGNSRTLYDTVNSDEHPTEGGRSWRDCSLTPEESPVELLTIVMAPGATLPRDAAVEWQLIALSPAASTDDEVSDDDDNDNKERVKASGSLPSLSVSTMRIPVQEEFLDLITFDVQHTDDFTIPAQLIVLDDDTTVQRATVRYV
ncbi:hypothetical protein PYCC9005_002984 [Savitreella phatthalungensis]